MLFNLKNLFYSNVLKDINLVIDRGECIVLRGSGAGALLYIFGKYITKYSGKISGKYSSALLLKESSDIFLKENVINEVAEYLRERKLDKDERMKKAKDILSLFSLDESFYSRKIDSLSEGEKKKVSLSSFFSLDRDIYALEEPLSNLDLDGKNSFFSYIDKITEEGKTVVMTSKEKIKACNRIIEIENGMITQDQHVLFQKISEREKTNEELIKTKLKKMGIIKELNLSPEEDANAFLGYIKRGYDDKKSCF